MKATEKLVAVFLTIVIAFSGATIGYSCAQFVKNDTINKLFMCGCGKVYLFHIEGKKISIIEIVPPGENDQQDDCERPKKDGQWI